MKQIKTVLFVLLFINTCFAQSDGTYNQSDSNNKWQFSISPYVWMTGIKGDITFDNQDSQKIDTRFKDLKKSMDVAFMLHTELDNGNWGLFSDIFYFKFNKEGEIKQPFNVKDKLEGNQTVIELAGFYKLMTLGQVLLIDGFVGARYTNQPIKIISLSMTSLDQNNNFIDPFFGLRYRLNNDKWFHHMRFDIGGFSVGSDINVKWNIILGYQFNKSFSLSTGFQLHQVRYEKDSFKSNLTNGGFGLVGTFSL